MHRTDFLAILFFIVLILIPDVAYALPKDDPFEDPVLCQDEAHVSVALTRQGLRLVDVEWEIEASNAKIISIERSSSGDCEVMMHMLLTSQFQWSLATKPSGSGAELAGISTLTTSLTPDVPGDYTIEFSACPTGCMVALSDGNIVAVANAKRELTVTAVISLAIPPETEPTLPPLESTAFTQVDDLASCGIWSEFLNAAWRPIEPWLGADDYKFVEGRVTDSKLASSDNILNHDDMDFLSYLDVDPPYKVLRTPKQSDIELEWEYLYYPDEFRPTRGDRISATGYWINDCGHDPKTEIHPPVMQVAHRARAIGVPESEGFGSNIYIPGIASDIWISRHAGDVTSDCSTSGLRQTVSVEDAISIYGVDPANISVPTGQTVISLCIPQGLGYDLSPINSIFEFNIYLPPNPQKILAPIKSAPPVPLYFKTIGRPGIDHGLTAPDPEISLCPLECPGETGETTFLRVQIDLSSFTGDSYSRRIEAGWVYPSPDNWDLRRWKIRLNALKIQTDGDGIFNDGDWRLWFNTNNKDHEWTKILKCRGCIEKGTYDFSGAPWETGSAASGRLLGPDVLTYPGQKIFVHTSGFEDDLIWNDSIGRIIELHPQEPRKYLKSTKYCKDCLRYELDYEILEGVDVGDARLTRIGQDIYDGYVVTKQDVDPDFRVISPSRRFWNHPDELIASNTPTRIDESKFFKIQGVEINALHDIPLEKFQEFIEEAESQNPEQLAESMRELRSEIDKEMRFVDPPDLENNLATLKIALPEHLWEEYFGDVDFRDNGRGISWWIFAVMGILVAVIAYQWWWIRRYRQTN